MPEETKLDANGQPIAQNNGGGANGADPNKKPDSATPSVIDFSKVGDEDFSRVFDDPRLWKHTRFKNLNDRAKKADEYEQAEQTRAQEELKKKGDWEKVAQAAETKAQQAEERANNAILDSRISTEAAKQGVVDIEAILKLIDRSNVKVATDGTVTGIAESVKALLEAKPYLKSAAGATTTIGAATNPGGGNKEIKFKHSQIKDPAFYQAHEAEIMEALKNGQVEHDL
jgi:hypothetical protein